MKKLSLFLFSFALLAAACNNKKSTETTSNTPADSNGTTTKPDAAMQQLSSDMEKKKEALTGLTPLPADQLKVLLPETFMGAKRTNEDVNANSGANQATAEYPINDTITVNLTIIDCGGPAGAGIYGMQYMSLSSYQQETDEEYTKSVEIGGNQGFEHCDKTTNDCTITFFTGDRYLVTLQGGKVGAPALKHAAAQLKLK